MSQQIQITGGAKVRNLEGVITGSSGVIGSLPINTSNGIPQLDVNGKILVEQLPNSIMEYKGTWNAATNTPTLANGTGNQGDVYLCEVAGTVNFGAGPITFYVGDQVIYSGSIWQRASGATGTVTSVALTESGDSLNITGSPITTSGTINIGFNGNSGQYINGAGNLTTFPSLTGFVPYTGATTNVDLGTYGLLADYLKLNVLPTSIPTTESTMAWNDTDGTMDIKLKGGNVTLQVGQEQVVRVVNKTGASLLEANYQVVRIRSVAEGGAQGQRLAVVLAQGDTAAHSKGVLGLVTETIADNQEGFITILGQVHEIDTTGTLQGETWVDGDKLYLSATTAGKLTKTPPVAPNHSVVVGYVEYAHAVHGKIFVDVNEGLSLDELHNVYAPSPSNNQSIFWNSSTLRYENNSIAGALGYTPANAATSISTTAPLSGGGDLSANRTLSISQATTSTNGYLSSTDWNTFNNKQNALGYTPVPTTRTLTINGTTYDLSADRSWSIVAGVSSVTATSPLFSSGGANPDITIQQASGSQAGYLSAADWTEFNTKQEQIDGLGFVKVSGTTLSYDNSSYTPTSRTLTINGVTYDLSANRTWTISTGVSGSGTTNYVPKFTGASTIGNSIVYDNGTNVGIGTSSPNAPLHVQMPSDGSAGVIFRYIGGSANPGLFISVNETTKHINLTGSGSSVGGQQLRLGAEGNANVLNIGGSNVLIGTTTDAGYKLDVNGTGRFSGIATFGSSGGSGLRVYGGSGTNQWDMYLNGANLRFSDNTGTGSFVVDRPATYSNSVTANSTSGISGTFTSSNFFGSIDLENTGGTATGKWNLQAVSGAQVGGSAGSSFGIYSYGASAYRLFINSSGNVGIGTSSPGSLLHLIGNGNNLTGNYYYNVRFQDAAAARGLIFGYISGETTGFIGADQASGNIAFVTHNGSTWGERMRITSGGEVGVGVVPTSGNKFWIKGIDSTSSNTSLLVQNSSNAWLLYVRNDGNVGIGTSSPNYKLDVGSSSTIGGYSDATHFGSYTPYDGSGWSTFNHYWASGGAGFRFQDNSSTLFTITSVGNVLIGTTTDAGYKLDVNGTGRFSGVLTLTQSNAGSVRPLVLDGTNTHMYLKIVTNSNYEAMTQYENPTAGAWYTGLRTAAGLGSTSSYHIYSSAYGGDVFVLNTSGSGTFASSVTATAFFESSDKRLKKELIDNPTSVNIENIKPKLYIKNGKEELGYYAQDFLSILPSAVSEGSDGMLSLSYSQVLVAKVSALEQEIKELKAKSN